MINRIKDNLNKDTHRHALAIGLPNIQPPLQSFVHNNVCFKGVGNRGGIEIFFVDKMRRFHVRLQFLTFKG